MLCNITCRGCCIGVFEGKHKKTVSVPPSSSAVWMFSPLLRCSAPVPLLFTRSFLFSSPPALAAHFFLCHRRSLAYLRCVWGKWGRTVPLCAAGIDFVWVLGQRSKKLLVLLFMVSVCSGKPGQRRLDLTLLLIHWHHLHLRNKILHLDTRSLRRLFSSFSRFHSIPNTSCWSVWYYLYLPALLLNLPVALSE